MYLTKCCFCLPLRTGILIGYYLKLILLAGYAIFWLSSPKQEGLDDNTRWFPIIVLGSGLLLEVIFSILLLVGLHKKHYKIVRIIYIYSVFLMGMELVISTVYIPLETYRLYATASDEVWWILLTSMLAALLAVVFQLYVVALLRSVLCHMRQACVSDPDPSAYPPRKPYVVY